MPTPHNQLGFAILLKFFFSWKPGSPQHPGEVPKAVVKFIAKQLKITQRSFNEYKWNGRTIKEHRATIRSFLGCRPTQRSDKQSLMTWLKAKILPLGLQINAIREQAYQQLRHLKLEPPSPKELTRLIGSATNQHEREFCRTIAGQLPIQTRKKMDDLLKTDSLRNGEENQYRPSEFNRLKADPGRLGLKSLLQEIEKLRLSGNSRGSH
ncbi:DUF4158 domain-containing protein (plasmid) [Acaryochloris sp. 'Moss Beach']|uniref:DUF4158 domain-containing protein n=1 Tax=Acaryochloris sp. 'Moss Beach' TaxID=2740837 RepID=UPI001F2E8D4A|nr:DUF4158 domain-containing protein [Acaryochloris sp. 'Moss Beach']UJB73317.1 DUF4158 domain-containing protein [Acaryochloris sp. 'Moss Beach']